MFIMGVGMLAAWGRFLYNDRNGRLAFIRQFMLIGMQASMVWVYPAYAYVFNQLSAGRQVAAMAFLPAIKMFYKNMFARMLREHPDLKACIVVFSADLYHVLFLSWCMNGSTSKTAAVSLMLADVLESIVVLHEIDQKVLGINSDFTSKPRTISLPNRAVSAVRLTRPSATLKRGTKPKIFVLVAHSHCKLSSRDPIQFVTHETRARSSISAAIGVKHNCIVPLLEVGAPVQVNRLYRARETSPTTGDAHLLTSPSSLVTVTVAARQASLTSDPGVDKARSLKLLRNSLGLLYTTEFVLLVEFTEVMVPCVYSLYLLVAFHMPNRAFLNNLRDKSLEEISSNILVLLGYSSMELISIIALAVILQRRTRISTLWQLAFALETNWLLAQANICLWVILAVQAPLEHYSVDFSFRFEWLKHN